MPVTVMNDIRSRKETSCQTILVCFFLIGMTYDFSSGIAFPSPPLGYVYQSEMQRKKLASNGEKVLESRRKYWREFENEKCLILLI